MSEVAGAGSGGSGGSGGAGSSSSGAPSGSTAASSASPAPAASSAAPATSTEIAASSGDAAATPGGDTGSSTPNASGPDAGPAPMSAAPAPGVAPFDWSAWDGSDAGLPETLREHAAGINAWHSARFSPMEADLEAARQQIESLTATLGTEDPRIAEFTALREQHAALQTKYDSLNAALDAYAEQMATAENDALMSANPQIFGEAADPIQAAHFAALVDEVGSDGSPLWSDLGGIIDLVKAGPAAINAARQLRQRGTPADVAIEFATGKLTRASAGRPAPAASASMIAGAGNTGGPPNISTRVLPPNATQRDSLRQIAADALHSPRRAG